MEPTAMMRPHFCATMSGSAALESRYGACTFTSNCRSQKSARSPGEIRVERGEIRARSRAAAEQAETRRTVAELYDWLRVRRGADAGVVDENVDGAAEGGLDARQQRSGRLAIGEVDVDGDGRAASALDLRDDLGELVRRPRAEGDGGALGGERDGDGAADAAAGPRHERCA